MGSGSQLFARRSPWMMFAGAVAGIAAMGGVGCGPVWHLDPDLGARIAAEKNKPMLIYFKTWDSSQHRNMRLEVFSDPAVKREMVDTVNVELEFAYFPEQRERYGIQRPQVCVMCDPRGRRVGTPIDVNRVPAPAQFLDWLQRTKGEAMPKPTSGPG